MLDDNNLRMKKIIAMAALVLSSVGAFAQYSAGDFTLQPKVGLNCSSLTEDDADYKAGFVGRRFGIGIPRISINWYQRRSPLLDARMQGKGC